MDSKQATLQAFTAAHSSERSHSHRNDQTDQRAAADCEAPYLHLVTHSDTPMYRLS